MTVFYGTAVADATLTTACTLVTVTGGTETSKSSTFTGTSDYGEVYSQGSADDVTTTSLPSPTAHGWICTPGSGTFAAGNWSASCKLSYNDATTSFTIRFYKYSSGSYTSIGTITSNITSTAVTTYSFASTSMSSVTFNSTDRLYVDLFVFDSTGASGQVAVVYESSSSTTGVASDMQITTATFTASSTHSRIADGLGGMFT